MLEALYKYAQDNKLAVRPGFKAKKIKYHICFSANGDFIGFSTVEDDAEPPMCPDIGENNTQGDRCNFLVSKAEIVLNIQTEKSGKLLSQKHDFYMDLLSKASENDDLFKIAFSAMKNDLDKIRKEYLNAKYKVNDLLSIKVDNIALETSSDYKEWWENYYKSLQKETQYANRCFITGELTIPTDVVDKLDIPLPSSFNPKKSERAKLICYDKDAFESYGFEKCENVSVSKLAMLSVNSALNKLLRENSHQIAGMKFVHWYSQSEKDDIMSLLFSNIFDDNLEINNANKDEELEEDEDRIQKMFNSINKYHPKKNQPPLGRPRNKYYMLSMSAAKSRVMIRSYDEGYYDDLWNNIKIWFEDICIDIPHYGFKWCSLYRMNKRLIKKSSEDEPSGLAPKIMYAIMHNTPLPDTVAAKALAYIRSDMYSGDEERRTALIPDTAACQILKAWLNRKYRKEKKEESIIMEKLDPNRASAAYQTGRLMAVYAAIQAAALGEVGAGVVERYYTSACTSPALVMGKLATMAQYHLSKLKGDNQRLYIFFSRMLEEISCQIGTSLPKTFTLEQQSEFALGYYFQRSQRYTSKKTEE